MLKSGTFVVYRMLKHSERPGPRAHDVHPAQHGDTYSYVVDKHWIVSDTLPDDKIVVQTRRGKRHVLDASNPNLRVARWWERLLLRKRFPMLDQNESARVEFGGQCRAIVPIA